MQSPPGGIQLLVSEDCLFLNIWAPMQNISQSLNSSNTKLPVMLFIHGGSFNSGSGVVYDSSALAQTGNVITITINYRLGAFGFLAAGPLQSANALNSTGNYGLQDQRAALQWVQRNIAQFGGDPKRVTVFGESAGAISICHHLVSPHSAGLFSAALMESGLCDARNMSFALTNSTSPFLNAISCSADGSLIECLRNRTSQEIFSAQRKVPSSAATGFLPWGPVIDGYELVKPPQEYLGNGTFSRVPVLLGTNLNEYSYFLCGRQAINISREGATEFLVGIFGKHRADEAIRLYDFEKYSSPVQLMIGALMSFSWHMNADNEQQLTLLSSQMLCPILSSNVRRDCLPACSSTLASLFSCIHLSTSLAGPLYRVHAEASAMLMRSHLSFLRLFLCWPVHISFLRLRGTFPRHS